MSYGGSSMVSVMPHRAAPRTFLDAAYMSAEAGPATRRAPTFRSIQRLGAVAMN